MDTVSAQKVLQGSETETRQLLGGTEETTFSLTWVIDLIDNLQSTYKYLQLNLIHRMHTVSSLSWYHTWWICYTRMQFALGTFASQIWRISAMHNCRTISKQDNKHCSPCGDFQWQVQQIVQILSRWKLYDVTRELPGVALVNISNG